MECACEDDIEPIGRNACDFKPIADGLCWPCGIRLPLRHGVFAKLYSSSIPVENVYELEEMLAGDYPLTPDPAKPIGVTGFNGLLAPAWPSAVLGPIDETKKVQGRALYGELCQSCHMPPISDKAFWEAANWAQPVPNPGDQPQSYLKVNLIPLSKVGTDPGQANILQTRQVQVPPFAAIDTSALCTHDPPKSAGTPTTSTSFAVALGYTVQSVVETWYAEHGTSPADRNKLNGYRPNCLQADLVYKARPLDGIWAVPPFLHNGSVPTIEDLLRPAIGASQDLLPGRRRVRPEEARLQVLVRFRHHHDGHQHRRQPEHRP